MEEHIEPGQAGWVDRVPASQELLCHRRGNVALAVLVVLGQLGLLRASEPLSWGMPLSGVREVSSDLGSQSRRLRKAHGVWLREPRARALLG